MSHRRGTNGHSRGGSRAITGVFLDAPYDATNRTAYTFSSVAGTVEDGILVIGVFCGNTLNFNEVVVGGVNATSVVDTGATARQAALWAVACVAGSVPTIVVRGGSGTKAFCGIGVWNLIGAPSATAVDTDSGDTTDPLNANLSVGAGGCVVGMAVGSAGASFSWTGGDTTENFDTVVEGTNLFSGSIADFAVANSSVNANANASGTLASGQIVAAAWDP